MARRAEVLGRLGSAFPTCASTTLRITSSAYNELITLEKEFTNRMVTHELFGTYFVAREKLGEHDCEIA